MGQSSEMASLNEAQRHLEAALERLERAAGTRNAGPAAGDAGEVEATEEVARRLDEVIDRLRTLLDAK